MNDFGEVRRITNNVNNDLEVRITKNAAEFRDAADTLPFIKECGFYRGFKKES